jgi:hypothetical protein
MAADDLYGTWTQDSTRSHYAPGAKAASHIRVYERAGQGFKVSCTETIGGRTVSWNYTAPSYDGRIYPVYGRADFDGIKSYQLSDMETLGIFTKAGLEGGAYGRKLSDDGKTLTVFEAGKVNGSGQPYWNTSVFTKS